MFTQEALRHFVFRPLLETQGMELQLPETLFSLLALSTAAIAASGYAINDYFDVRADRLNRPAQAIVGVWISKRNTIFLYGTITAGSLILSVYLSWAVGVLYPVLIHFGAALMLWFYSSALQHKVLAGNLTVAFLVALVPMLVFFYELPLLYPHYGGRLFYSGVFIRLAGWTAGVSLFAFLTTMSREIIKDIEDAEGDRAVKSQTLAVRYGTGAAKSLCFILLLLTFLSLLAANYFLFHGWETTLLLLATLYLPLTLAAVKLIRASASDDYRRISTLMKIIMLAGIIDAAILVRMT